MKNLMKNKLGSLFLIFVMYIFAVSIGAVVYFASASLLNNPIWQMLLADIAGTFVIWGLGLLFRNASTYDPYWSIIPPVMLLGWTLVLKIQLTFPIALLFLGILVWAVRLTYNWVINWKDLEYQDWRYSMIKKNNPKIWFLSNLFGINLMPTIIVFIQMIGAYKFLVASPSFNILILLGFVMTLGAALIQFIADKQMLAFRMEHNEKKSCINEGLWKYSRHPNYFGEVLVWWGVWMMYFGASGKIDFMVISPILMTALFLFISIPMMEKKIIQSRPEYLEYKRHVSVLVPFFVKRESIETKNQTD